MLVLAMRLCRSHAEPPTAHEGAVYGICTDSCNRWVATGGYDGMLRVWDFKKRTLLGEIQVGLLCVSSPFDVFGGGLRRGSGIEMGHTPSASVTAQAAVRCVRELAVCCDGAGVGARRPVRRLPCTDCPGCNKSEPPTHLLLTLVPPKVYLLPPTTTTYLPLSS